MAYRTNAETNELLKDVRDVVKATIIGEIGLLSDRIGSLETKVGDLAVAQGVTDSKVSAIASTKTAIWVAAIAAAAGVIVPVVEHFFSHH